MIASAVAAMALLHFSFGAIKDLHTLGQVRKQTRAIAAPVIGDASGDPAAALSKKMAELGRRLKLYGAAGTFGSPLDVMQMLSAATPAHLGIEVDDMSVDEGGVKLSGRADSFATIDQFKKALGSNAFFSDIQVTDAKVGAEANKVQFRLSASISSTGAPD